MARPTRKTAQRIKRMCELHSAGASSREIGEELGIHHVTITRWLKDAGLRANGGQGARAGRERSQPRDLEKAMAEAQAKLAEYTSTPAPSDFAGVLEKLRHGFALASGFVEFHMEGARAGTSNAADLNNAVKLQDFYATRIRELSPREPDDPASDPFNVEAAAEVRRKFAALVEKAEAHFICATCGGDPYGRGRR